MYEFEDAWNEALMLHENGQNSMPRLQPGVIGTLQAYAHYLDESGTPRQFFIEDIITGSTKYLTTKPWRKRLGSPRNNVSLYPADAGSYA